MRLRNETKVGLIVTSGIAVLIAIYWFLGGVNLRSSTYLVYSVFPNVQKLDRGASVRMAGVKVGIVSETCLTNHNRARVNMLIDKGQFIPRDSKALITTGGFIGENYVELTPGSSNKHIKEGQRLASEVIVGPDQILRQVGVLLDEFHKSTKGVNELLADPEMIKTIKDTVQAMHDAANSASQMAMSAKKMVAGASPELQEILRNVANATQGAERISSELQGMITSDVRPGMKSIIKRADAATGKLDTTMAEAAELMTALKGSASKLSGLLDQFGGAASMATDTISNLKDASVGVKEIATDREIKDNIKKTMQNAAKASEQLNELVTSLNCRFKGKTRPSSELKAVVPEYGISANSLWNTNQGSYRFDANYTFLTRDKSFCRLGAYNIGENTGANIQGGTVLGDKSAVRYGLYDSRVGIGMDTRLGAYGLISADLFRPDDPQLEVRGVLGLSPRLGIYAGLTNVLDKSNDDVMVGIRYRK